VTRAFGKQQTLQTAINISKSAIEMLTAHCAHRGFHEKALDCQEANVVASLRCALGGGSTVSR
jgi:hypothetical protein